jgi:CrcB protein
MADSAYRLLVAVGFCGAYTTFSSYGVETLRLLEGGHFWAAGASVLANNLLSLAAAVAGVALARWV